MQESELVVRAQKHDHIYELLPSHMLEGDFPHAFVQDYVHWLDIHSASIEWRPLTDMWTSPPDTWRLRTISSRGDSHLAWGALRLLNLRSPTTKDVCAVLRPLEEAIHVHVILNSETGVLDV